MRRKLSLRSRFIVWTSAVVVVSSGVLMIGVYEVSSRAMEKQADEEMKAVVAKTAGELDLWVEARERDAVNLSELQPLVDACVEHKLEDAQKTLDRIQGRSPFYENVFLAGTDGKLFLDSIGGKSVGIDLMSIDAFRANVEHALRGELWFGEASKSPATGRPVALLTAPIRAGNQVVGILGTPIELSSFSDSFVSKYRIRDTGYLYMFDAAGIMLAHPDASKIMSENVNSHDYGREMLSRPEGSIHYEYNGAARMAYFQRAQKKPWTIVASVPVAELLASARTIQLWLLLFGGLMLGGTVVAVSFLAGRISRAIREAVGEIENSVQQFFAASSQISSSSQALASGASEQAASIEETSASAEEISAITRQNNERSQKVAGLMNEAIPIVTAVNNSHQELAAALNEMGASSEKVAKVIRMIDEIAFQTNILALNAAVEAARAGEAGMGFAVVADEVRNLAHRSATAAKDTSQLIEEALSKSRESKAKLNGVLTAMAANNRIAGAVEVETDQIRAGSEEQARGIAQIAEAIGRMNQLTQHTAAQAEESASAAEELSAQSQGLKEVVGRLTTVVTGS
jgi:methyl-accepting chemotaxis protein